MAPKNPPQAPEASALVRIGMRRAGLSGADLAPEQCIQLHIETERENRRACVRYFAAVDLDLRPWEQPDAIDVDDLAAMLAEGWPAGIAFHLSHRFVLAGSDGRNGYDDLAATNAIIKRAIEDLCQQTDRHLRERGAGLPDGTSTVAALVLALRDHPDQEWEVWAGQRLSHAVQWAPTRDRWRLRRSAKLGAAFALYKAREANEPEADAAWALEGLELAIKEQRDAHRKGWPTWANAEDLAKLGQRDRMFLLDALHGDFLTALSLDDAQRWHAEKSAEWAQASLTSSEPHPRIRAWLDPLLPDRLLGLALWPAIRAKLEREISASRFRLPAKATGEFGALMGRDRAITFAGPEGAVRVARVTIRQATAEGALILDGIPALRAHSGASLSDSEVREYLSAHLGNETWRMLIHFVSQRRADGDIWISESDAADAFGYKRESKGRGGAHTGHSQTTIASIRKQIRGLTSTAIGIAGSVESTPLRGTDAFAYLVPNTTRTIGQKRFTVYRFGTVADALFCKGSAFVLLPPAIQRTPESVSHTEWADALKVLCYMLSFARLNTKGQIEAAGGAAHPWRLGMASIAAVANVKVASMKPKRARARVLALLEILRAKKHIKLRLTQAVKGGELVCFDVPAWRPELEGIGSKPGLPQGVQRRRLGET